MEKYRKSDQYYIDKYDRLTIESLKQIESQIEEAGNNPESHGTYEHFVNELTLTLKFSESGANDAKSKRATISRWIERDDRRDRLVAKYPKPPAPYCNVCNDYMNFLDYDFINDDFDLFFIFSCEKGKGHSRMFYSDGQPYRVTPNHCPYCNSTIKTIVKKNKYKITTTERCTQCAWSNVIVFDLPKPTKTKILPIDDVDRKKYCTDFIGRKSFTENLQALAKFISDDDAIADSDRIEKINLPQVEERLFKAIEREGFIKFQFDKPKITSFIAVKFSIQDPTNRTQEKSVKVLKKAIVDELFPTNWRLMSTEINYKLGYIDGQIKGVDLKEDLAKIAREIDGRK